VQSASLEQSTRQAVAPHTYGTQLCVPGFEQVPDPEQNAGGVYVVTLHEGFPHWTEAAAWVQAPLPLQVPVLPQGGFGVQRASAVAAGRLAHEPALAPTLQAWHVGQLPTPQQTPSVQKPEPHSLALPHAMPLPFLGRQLPPGPVQ
jgi:hypothetical protein